MATKKYRIVFDDDTAERHSVEFQQRYGEQGEELIESFGEGQSVPELIKYGAVTPWQPGPILGPR